MSREQRKPFGFVSYSPFFTSFSLLIILFALSLTSCDWDSVTSGNRFEYNLQGTWVTHDEGERYTGRLVITYDRITITGFSQNQTPNWMGNDNERPFAQFIRGVALRGYSDEGRIYIEHMGTIQSGIPYLYWDSGYSWASDRVELLEFDFDGRQQILRKE